MIIMQPVNPPQFRPECTWSLEIHCTWSSNKRQHTKKNQNFSPIQNLWNKRQQKFKSSFTLMMLILIHFGLYLTVFGLIMIAEWRKLVHPLILTLWFWFSYFQIDIVTQYTFYPLYDIIGRCRTNYGLASGAEAQNVLHCPHKQLWVKKTWFHTTAIQSHFFGPQLLY